MSDELILREAVPNDALQLAEFYRSIQDYSYIETASINNDQENLRNSLAMIFESTENNIVLALNDGKIIGFCSVDHGELGIVVDKDFWHLGVGSELMYDTLTWFENDSQLTELKLAVYKQNLSAIGLYEKFGFAVTDTAEQTLLMNKKR